MGNDASWWFPVNVGLRQGRVMSPWLFNVYLDGFVREVTVWVLGKLLELRRANDGRFEKNQLLFSEDTALEKENVKIFFIQKKFICYYNVYIPMVK